jgi:hypothetical protein
MNSSHQSILEDISEPRFAWNQDWLKMPIQKMLPNSICAKCELSQRDFQNDKRKRIITIERENRISFSFPNGWICWTRSGWNSRLLTNWASETGRSRSEKVRPQDGQRSERGRFSQYRTIMFLSLMLAISICIVLKLQQKNLFTHHFMTGTFADRSLGVSADSRWWQEQRRELNSLLSFCFPSEKSSWESCWQGQQGNSILSSPCQRIQRPEAGLECLPILRKSPGGKNSIWWAIPPFSLINSKVQMSHSSRVFKRAVNKDTISTWNCQMPLPNCQDSMLSNFSNRLVSGEIADCWRLIPCDISW